MSEHDETSTAPHGDTLGELVPQGHQQRGHSERSHAERGRQERGHQERDRPEPAPAGELGLTGILDAIAEAVAKARAMPMSASVLVSRAELLDLVTQAKDALPSQLVAADEVLAQVEAKRAEAAAQAERLLDEARREAAELVSKEAVTAEALDQADRIRAEAREDAERMRREADDYCDRRLADFEIDLGRVLAQVQAGRAKLADRLE